MAESSETEVLTTGDFLESAWDRGHAPTLEHDALLGATLNGTYVVERVLGEGGMGRVYLARHTRIAQKRVAIKVLHEEYATNQEVLTRFQREAEAGAAVSHPNVMTVLDVDRTPNGAPYLVCEYLEGVDLGEYLKRVKKLDVPKALQIGQQLCQGLAAAHARGVVHRDLKPQNIFLVGDFSDHPPLRFDLKILDFGLSRFLETTGSTQLTKTGYVMGTPAYMAPEQARGERVDQRADVYGVGAILFTALTGRPPFEADTPQATVLAVLNSQAPRPRSLEPTIPPELEIVLERALAREPSDRYQDVLVLEQALLNLSRDAPPASAAQPLAMRASAPSADALSASELADVRGARPRLVLVLIALLLLAICTLVTAVTGVELAIGYAFNRVELRLLLLAILGISLTPVVLWLGAIRRKVWGSSPRVLALLKSLRAALVAALVAYGLGALALQFLDDFVARAVGNPQFPRWTAAWPGWNVVLAAVALFSAIFLSLRRKMLANTLPGFRRSVVLALITVVYFALLGASVVAGLRVRDRLERHSAGHATGNARFAGKNEKKRTARCGIGPRGPIKRA